MDRVKLRDLDVDDAGPRDRGGDGLVSLHRAEGQWRDAVEQAAVVSERLLAQQVTGYLQQRLDRALQPRHQVGRIERVLVGFACGGREQNQVAVLVERADGVDKVLPLVMLVKEANGALDEGQVVADRQPAVLAILEHHQRKLELAEIEVANPRRHLFGRVEVRWPPVIGVGRFGPAPRPAQRQAKVLQLLGEGTAAVSPVVAGARLGAGQRAAVVLKLRRHEVKVAALEHRPVEQPLILRGVASAAPHAEVGRFVGKVVAHKAGVVDKQAAVELRRIFAGTVAAEHVAEELVVAPDLPHGIGWVGIGGVQAYVAALPEVRPPGAGDLSRRVDVHTRGARIQDSKPVVERLALRRVQNDIQPVLGRGLAAAQAPAAVRRLPVLPLADVGSHQPRAAHQPAEGAVALRVGNLLLDRLQPLLLDQEVIEQAVAAVAVIEAHSITVEAHAVRFGRHRAGIADPACARMAALVRNRAWSLAPVFVARLQCDRMTRGHLDVNHGLLDFDPHHNRHCRLTGHNLDIAMTQLQLLAKGHFGLEGVRRQTHAHAAELEHLVVLVKAARPIDVEEQFALALRIRFHPHVEADVVAATGHRLARVAAHGCPDRIVLIRKRVHYAPAFNSRTAARPGRRVRA